MKQKACFCLLFKDKTFLKNNKVKHLSNCINAHFDTKKNTTTLAKISFKKIIHFYEKLKINNNTIRVTIADCFKFTAAYS